MKPRQDAVLDWLLEKKDPGVRALTLRDVLDAPDDDPEVRRARRAALRASPVREILAAQQPEGWWVKPGPGYSPKYTATVWSIIFLGQFGASGEDHRIQRGLDYVLDHSRARDPYGGFAYNATPAGMVHCLEGNLCAAMVELGALEDARLQQAIDWLARSITGEGIAPASSDRRPAGETRRYLRSGNSAPGFVCSVNNQRPCAWGAIPALDALSKIPLRRRSRLVRRAILAGAAFLLAHDLAAAAYPTPFGGPPSRSWFKLGYPMGYVQDVLRNLEVLTALGKASARQVQQTAEWLLQKRGPDGRWRMEYSYNGKMWSDLERTRTPSKWVTLRARRVLHRMGVEA
jgi:hypothetical protein